MAGAALFLAILAYLAPQVTAATSVEVQEQEFVISGTTERFQIVGVDYQPGGQAAYGTTNSVDPLSDASKCLRDAALMQGLGINTIRSYNVDPTLNHDECVSIFQTAGIFMILDVNSPLAGQSIDRSDPSSSYNIGYLEHIFSVVEAFKDYPNVLGFFAGNEVINDVSTAGPNPPYIRAVQRDLKNYIAAHSSRTIPVGYSAADVRDVLEDTWAYLQCDNSNGTATDMSRSDFFGLNSYSWCGSGSSYTISGYDQLVAMFNSSTIPVFFSEYGCNVPSPRVFDEVPTLYGPLMTSLSGGLVYEWTQDTNNYGLIDDNSNGSATLRQDFLAFSSQLASLDVSLLTSTNSTATSLEPPKCSAGLISNDGFSTDFDIPSPPDGAAALISSGVSNPPTGKIVSVTQTSVTATVYNVDGSVITGLAIKSVSGQNHPGNAAYTTGTSTSGTASASATAAATTTTKTAGAYRAVATNGVVLGAAVAVAALAL